MWLYCNLGSPACSLLATWLQDEETRSSTGLKAGATAEEQERGFKEKESAFYCLLTKFGADVRALIPP